MTDKRILEAVDHLAYQLVAITATALSEGVGSLDLTLAQWRVLVVVGERRSNPLRVGDVAARINASLPSTSRILRRLERRGLITTERDERDRRATLVSLTPAGTTARRRVIQARQKRVGEALKATNGRLTEAAIESLELIVDALAPIS
jgi:DNA-binding MarR family transcriptional regulator